MAILKLIEKVQTDCLPQQLWSHEVGGKTQIWGNDGCGEVFCLDAESRELAKTPLFSRVLEVHGDTAFGFDESGRLRSIDLRTRQVAVLGVRGGESPMAIDLDNEICHFVSEKSVVGATFDGELIGEVEFDFSPSSLLLVENDKLWISGRRTYILDLKNSSTHLIDEIRSQHCFQILSCTSKERVFCIGDHIDIFDLRGNIIDRIGRSVTKGAVGPYDSLWVSRVTDVHPETHKDAIELGTRVFYVPGCATTSLYFHGDKCVAIATGYGEIEIYSIL